MHDFLDPDSTKGKLFKSYRKSYGWQLVVEDSVMLQSKLLFHSRRKARQDWRDSCETKGQKLNISVLQEDQMYEIQLFDGYKRLIAHSQKTTEEVSEEYLSRIEALIKNENNIKLLETGEAYGFQLPEPSNPERSLLTSYDLFASRTEAFQAMEDVIALSKRKSSYYVSGEGK